MVKSIPKTQEGLDEMLTRAVIEGSAHKTVRSIKNGADTKIRDAEGNTLLMLAAANSGTSILRVLLRAGADTSATNNQNMTALDWAKKMRRHSNTQILESLTKKNTAIA